MYINAYACCMKIASLSSQWALSMDKTRLTMWLVLQHEYSCTGILRCKIYNTHYRYVCTYYYYTIL